MRFYSSQTVLKEIKSGQRIYQEKPDFTRVTDVVECCQTHWKLLRVQHVCNRCATKISKIFIGHFSVKQFAGKCPFFLRVTTSGATDSEYFEMMLASIEKYLLDDIARQRDMSKITK